MGIFNDNLVLTTYEADLELQERILGGVPNNPKLIEGWIRTNTGITDDVEERRQLIYRTMIERDPERFGNLDPNISYEDLVKASEDVAGMLSVNGFKRDDDGSLYIENRQVKAMLRESINILFAGEKWGAVKEEGRTYAGKGPKNFFVERVAIGPRRIHLKRKTDGGALVDIVKPDDLALIIGHVVGAQGPRSTLSYHEYVERPWVTVRVMVTLDSIDQGRWEMAWVHAQRQGLGAVRSQGEGAFDIWRWDKIEQGPVRLPRIAKAEESAADADIAAELAAQRQALEEEERHIQA